MKNKNGNSPPEFFSAQISRAQRFYLNLQPPPGVKFVVVCGGVEHCAPDYKIQRDTFPFYSIEYVAHGEGGLKLNQRNYDLRPGIVFSYGPGVRQKIISSSQRPLVKYFVDFYGTHAAKWIRSAGLATGKVSEIFPPNEIQPLFDELIRCGQRGTSRSPELCRRILDCLGLKLREVRTPAKSAESAAFSTYLHSHQHIAEHFARLRTLEQIAEECHVNTAYLCRLFRKFGQISPYQLLTRLKINAAAEHLQQPGALVKNVATDLGFANPFHFSRVFKNVFGISPDAFRKIR